MPETKFDDNFITETPPNPMHPQTREMVNEFGVINTLYINDELMGKLKGAYYLETSLVVRPSPEDKPGGKPHTHDWDEYLVFLGTKPEDPFDLGGEIEFWLGGEKHLVTKSCAIFIPRGVPHCPLYTRRVERPFISFSTGPTVNYHPQES
jgi:mannose-6-phosphate isomerase-like protein (cupin superfamily)